MSEQKNFINFHVLISHSPSCLNRDDQNMQKRAVFGGVERIRISSQSLKRAMRTSSYYSRELGSPSIRSNKLEKLTTKFKEVLKDKYSEEIIKKAIEWISGKEGFKSDDEVASVAPWAVAEVAMFCDRIQAEEKNGLDQEKLRKQIKKDAGAFRKNFEKAIDIALSGRMATFGLMNTLPVDGALAVAHAITTHAAQADVDWFTAVDDLMQETGEKGAGHLDTQEFSSGVFYRYASLDISLLQKNLGGATRQRALDIARHVFHMLCTVVPSAKQQAFAAHNLADFAIVTLDEQPISLANAFEKPVEKERSGGYLKPSISALLEYFNKMKQRYNLGRIAAGCPDDIGGMPEGVLMLASFPAVEDWIANDGKKD